MEQLSTGLHIGKEFNRYFFLISAKKCLNLNGKVKIIEANEKKTNVMFEITNKIITIFLEINEYVNMFDVVMSLLFVMVAGTYTLYFHLY